MRGEAASMRQSACMYKVSVRYCSGLAIQGLCRGFPEVLSY
jgi:hypothetical protein